MDVPGPLLEQIIGAPVVGLDAFILSNSVARFTRWEIMDFDEAIWRAMISTWNKTHGCAHRAR